MPVRVVAVGRQALPVGRGEPAQLVPGAHVHGDEQVEAHARGEMDAVEGAGGRVDGRVRPLDGFGVGHDAGHLEELSPVVHRFLGPGEPDHLDALLHDAPHVRVLHAEALVGPGVGMAAPGREAHAAVAQQVQGGGLLGQLHGVVDGKGVHRHPEPQPPGPLGGRPQDHVGRRQQGEAGGEVDLGHPIAVVAQGVGQLGLLQELFQQGRGNAFRRTLYLGKEADFHARFSLGPQAPDCAPQGVLYRKSPPETKPPVEPLLRRRFAGFRRN